MSPTPYKSPPGASREPRATPTQQPPLKESRQLRRVTLNPDGTIADEAIVRLQQPVESGQPVDDSPAGPTVRAVVAYAAELRRAAEQRMAADPWARPYWPTSSAARKMSQRLGPQGALDRLRQLAVEHERRDLERDAESERALGRLRRVRRRSDSMRSERLAQLTPGQRIDRAIAELQAVSAVPAARVDGDVVHGGAAPARPPRHLDEPASVARRIADEAARDVEEHVRAARRRAAQAAQDVERELDAARRRDLEAAA